MNFPLDFPIFRLLLWLVDTAGVGGIVVSLFGGGTLVAYGLALWWIRAGGQADEVDTYSYPTAALHPHEEK